MGQHRRPDDDRRIVARDDFSGQVDARDERADPGDLAVRARREAVLVVDARPEDADLDLTRGQVRLVELADAALDAVVDLLGDVGAERGGDRGHRHSLSVGQRCVSVAG